MFGMSLSNVKQALSALGVSCNRNSFGEYVINKHGATYETAYFTDDLEDAYLTGTKMARG